MCMTFNEKISKLRKEKNWSQDQLAEKLYVTRQAVSKWESGQSMPDLDKIVLISDLFDVSTDYLLKDNEDGQEDNDEPDPALSLDLNKEEEDQDPAAEVHYSLSLEQVKEYLEKKRKMAPILAIGVMLCILSPVTLLVLAGMSTTDRISEGSAAGIGIITLLVIVACAVGLFIYFGYSFKSYNHLEKEDVLLDAQSIQYVKQQEENYSKQHSACLIAGIVLCILSAIPILSVAFINSDNVSFFAEYYEGLAVSGTLVLVAIGVGILVRNAEIQGSFDILLQQGDYSPQHKKLQPYLAAYWLIVVAIYLAWSFWSRDWDNTWTIFVLAGVLCPVYIYLIKRHLNIPAQYL